MRSLLARIFLSFWLIIGITVGTAALAGYWYAEQARREREAYSDYDLGDSILAASAALESGGRKGLADWLGSYTNPPGVVLYILDADGKELLGRQLPPGFDRMAERHRRHLLGRDHRRRGPPNLRRARPLDLLVANDGSTYTVIAAPGIDGPLLWLRQSAGFMVLLMALLVSAAVSYFLARAITRPVHLLRNATVQFAGGDLGTRVHGTIGNRRDELGMLARDFDQMAAKLQRSSEQQTELSRNISHELRSPLARLRVALELARRQSGDLVEFDRIDLESERLDDLIGQILSYTRFESAGSENRQDLDLADLLRAVVDDVNYECKAAGINDVSVAADLPARKMVSGYRAALTSAFENVLRNAVRHSPSGCEVKIQMDTDSRNDDAVITIADEGTGVSDADLPQLFEPFFRTEEANRDDSTNGSGLGLAIARRAVHLNGGVITASNRDGGGLLITIRLPVVD